MKYFVIVILILLTSCTNSIVNSNSAMNSGTPIYMDGNNTYYCKCNNYVYTLCSDKDGETVIKTLNPYEYITSIFVKGDNIYYNVVDSETISIMSDSVSGGESKCIFSCKRPSNILKDDFIYVSEDTSVYYFIPQNALYKITDNGGEEVLHEADDCVIANGTVYYALNGAIYSKQKGSKKETKIFTKEEIMASKLNEKLIDMLGDGYVNNMLIYNEKLYFLFTDWYSGGIFYVDTDGGNLNSLYENIRVNKFSFDENGDIYLLGNDIETQIKGLLKVMDDSVVLISDMELNGFYVNHGCYFYQHDKLLYKK